MSGEDKRSVNNDAYSSGYWCWCIAYVEWSTLSYASARFCTEKGMRPSKVFVVDKVLNLDISQACIISERAGEKSLQETWSIPSSDKVTFARKHMKGGRCGAHKNNSFASHTSRCLRAKVLRKRSRWSTWTSRRSSA
jgi:hypothetical protein